MTKTKARKYEFQLSDKVPEAVLEADLKRAEDAWKARSDRVADAVEMPPAPYRIRGDSDEGAWFAEKAEVVRSCRPSGSYLYTPLLYAFGPRWGSEDYDEELEREILFDPGRRSESSYRKQIAALDKDQPTAKLEWRTVGRHEGYRTYARALKRLQEELEPVHDESTYFRADGSHAG